jgi:hypothetical protein
VRGNAFVDYLHGHKRVSLEALSPARRESCQALCNRTVGTIFLGIRLSSVLISLHKQIALRVAQEQSGRALTLLSPERLPVEACEAARETHHPWCSGERHG